MKTASTTNTCLKTDVAALLLLLSMSLELDLHCYTQDVLLMRYRLCSYRIPCN